MKRPINLNRFPNLMDEDYVWLNDNSCLTERDFYPPSDNRTWKSNIEDINGGDNFVDYCEYIFNLLEKEEYFES